MTFSKMPFHIWHENFAQVALVETGFLPFLFVALLDRLRLKLRLLSVKMSVVKVQKLRRVIGLWALRAVETNFSVSVLEVRQIVFSRQSPITERAHFELKEKNPNLEKPPEEKWHFQAVTIPQPRSSRFG